MQIDFKTPGAWSSLNELVGEKLGLNLDKSAARMYQGIGHALVEVVWGVAKLFPHKKKIYYFQNMDPTYDAAVMQLAKEGYQLVALDLAMLSGGAPPAVAASSSAASVVTGSATPQTLETWAAALGREDLFVLYSVDEPILGRAYDVAKLETALSASTVFKIRVSHSRHFFESSGFSPSGKSATTAAAVGSTGAGITASHASTTSTSVNGITVDRNSAFIYSLGATQAMVLVGERGRIGAVTADQLPVVMGGLVTGESTQLSSILDWFAKPRASAQKNILDFENTVSTGSHGQTVAATPFFTSHNTGASSGGVARVYDRAVIFWLDMDGHAVIDRLAQKLGFVLHEPGFETRLETTSLSRWGGVRTMDFLKSQTAVLAEQNPATVNTAIAAQIPNVFRGLVMISHELLTEQLPQQLVDVRASILKDQGG